ncbi:hypothetical protein LIER_18929 [Lithospermum erythrorhizon]|uniref:Uncharacterized protein n=1 Tax=Lithospermum erythrorhizon TaxID=34254 RepID=A0AAV3QHI0_LITER
MGQRDDGVNLLDPVMSTPASQHSFLRDNSNTPVLGKMNLPKMLCLKLGHGDKDKDLDKRALVYLGGAIILNQLEIKDVHDRVKIPDRGIETDASFPQLDWTTPTRTREALQFLDFQMAKSEGRKKAKGRWGLALVRRIDMILSPKQKGR